MRRYFGRRILAVLLSLTLAGSMVLEVSADIETSDVLVEQDAATEVTEGVTDEIVTDDSEAPELVVEDVEPEESEEDSYDEPVEPAEADETIVAEANPEYASVKPMAKSNVSISNVCDGLQLTYQPAKNQAGTSPVGYLILYRSETSKWKLIAADKKPMYTKFKYYKHRAMKAGMNYYAVVPCYNANYYDDVIASGMYSIDAELADSCAVKYYWMSKMTSVTAVRSGTTLTGGWAKAADASGYQFQYARNPIFVGAKSVDVSGGNKQSVTVNNVKKVKYYGRVRSYKVVNGIKYYSDWGLSMGDNYNVAASTTAIKFNNKTRNLYIAAGQAINTSGYSVIQGGCTDGTYMYYVMENQKKERCKIAKVRRSDGKVIKVSAAMNIGHGNGLTYNSKAKELVAIHNKPYKKRVSRINPSTLKIIKSKDVEPGKSLYGDGVHRSNVADKLSGIDGYISASYISSRNQFAFLTRGSCSEILITDDAFKPLYMITLNKKKAADYYYQDVYLTKDYILVAQSGNINLSRTYKSCDNPLFVYDYSGRYLGRLTVKSRYELENVCTAGGMLYYSFHTSWDFPTYTWKYVKTVAKTAANKKTYNVKNKYKTRATLTKYKVYQRVRTGYVFKRMGYAFKEY